jgi:DNA polymerase V
MNELKVVEIDKVIVTEILLPEEALKLPLPLFLESVSAGFPSPADDYIEGKLDLNDYLVRNKLSTFFVRVTGDSMKDVGIYSGDLLIVDRSLTPKEASIVIAIINGELLVKRMHHENNKLYLLPENKNYQALEVTQEMNFDVWGVVTNVIHSVV